jgi:CRISPR/Cas system-associated exonuclease Cas4 (RecB family)
VAEASYVADRAAELVRSGRFRAEEIAVVVRDKRRYESALATALRDRGLVLETGRRAQHPLAVFVYSVLKLLDDTGSDSARNAVSESPYFKMFQQYFSRRWENDLSEAAADVDDLMRALSVEKPKADEPRLQDVCGEVLRRATSPDGMFDLGLFLNSWLHPFLCLHPRYVSLENLTFAAGLADEWRAYSDAVGSAGGRRTLREFLALSNTLSATAGRERTATWRGRVGFYSVHELSSRRFPVVIAAGCSETSFPALPPSEEYIPYAALQDCLRSVIDGRPIDLHLARSNDEFLRDEYALMLTALSRAGERLELTAPRQVGGQATPAPSRALQLLQGDSKDAAIGRAPSIQLRMAAAADKSAGEPAAPTGYLAGELWRHAAPDARDVKRKEKAASPSALSTFTQCPRQYFYSRVLRVEEKRSPAMAFGTLFHELMDDLSKDNRTHGELSAAIRSADFAARVEEVIDQSEGFADAAELEKKAAHFHLRGMAARFIQMDATRSDGYRIEDTEKELRFEHGGSRFYGKADRIDEGSSGRVVIDYKTGKNLPVTGKYIRIKSLAGYDKPEDRLWQVPFYARGAGPDDKDFPDVFCYYAFKPDGTDVIVGVAIGEETDAAPAAETFGVEKKRIGYITPAELEESLDEAASIAKDMFADRVEYERTDNRERCSRCDYRRICERTQ